MINNFDYSCIVIRMPQHKRLLYFYCYKECLLLTFNKIYVSSETPTNSCFRLAFQRQNTMLVYGIRCFVFVLYYLFTPSEGFLTLCESGV